MSHHHFQTTIVVADDEVKIDVEFEFQPEEKSTHYYPGAKASIEIESAKVGSNEIPNWVFNCISQQIADDAWEYLKSIKESEILDKADYLYEQAKERRYA